MTSFHIKMCKPWITMFNFTRGNVSCTFCGVSPVTVSMLLSRYFFHARAFTLQPRVWCTSTTPTEPPTSRALESSATPTTWRRYRRTKSASSSTTCQSSPRWPPSARRAETCSVCCKVIPQKRRVCDLSAILVAFAPFPCLLGIGLALILHSFWTRVISWVTPMPVMSSLICLWHVVLRRPQRLVHGIENTIAR